MRAEELMIGDWVDFYHPYEPEKKIVTRHRVTENFECGLVGISNHPNSVHADHIEPVKITQEILEKNGFNLLEYAYGMNDPFWSYSNRSVLVDVTIIRTNNVNVIDWFNVKISTRNDIKQIYFHGVKYVHELQHALKLCRIKKEIEL